MPNIIEEKIQEFEEQKFFTFLEDAEWEESAKYFLRQALTEVATKQREADKAVLKSLKTNERSISTFGVWIAGSYEEKMLVNAALDAAIEKLV